MIEWLVGAAVFGLVGELFGASRRPSSPPSYQPNNTRPKFTLTPQAAEEQKPETAWDAAKFHELSVALDWLERPCGYPAACETPPVLSEAAKYRGFLKQELARLEDTIDDEAVCERIRDFLKDPNLVRDGAIAAQLERDLTQWESFLDKVEIQPLSAEQRRAVLSEEDATLVLAGAGSGKTSVITAKATYLLKSGIREPGEILPLAFGREAANEMASRIGQACNAQVKAWTFHALAYHIIGDVEGTKPPLASHAGDQKRYSAVIRRILRQLVANDKKIADMLFDWFTQFPIECGSEWDYETKHAWYTHVESLNLRTLQGEKVRSYEEFLIANWLYRNGIEYEYEPQYEHRLPDSGRRGYTPDFRLTESGIYIEHFGVRKEKSPIGFGEMLVTAPFVDRKEYLASMEWKRKIHASLETQLIETYSYERQEGRLLEALAEKLGPHVTLRPRAIETIYDRVVEMGHIDSFTQLLGTFLLQFKGGSYTRAGCQSKADRLNMGERGKAFLAVFEPVLRQYQIELGERIDFEDMVLRAAGYVESGAYQSPFRHILVDEFQDISQDRARLVGALKTQHGDARIFAVGDDWQSIYRFAGADIHIMRSFGSRFGGEFGPQKDIHQVVDLGRTFRSVDKIALAARRFVLQNPAQIEKTIIPAAEAEGPALRVVWTKRAKQENELLETLANLTEVRTEDRGSGKVASVLLLARYRHERPDMAAIGRKFPNLSLSFKTIHGSKGLEADHVVILGCNNGKYGFPSEITDDPILSLVSPEGEPFQHAEERRIMYVAMTRARTTVTLLASEAEPSCFVRELVSDTEYGLATSTGSMAGHVPCSECGGRLLPVPARDGRVWYRCEHNLMCRNYMPACSQCGIGIPTVSGASGILECSHCGASHHECPKCSDGWLVERHGPYGDFFGCIRYPDCTGKANVSEVRSREAGQIEGVGDIEQAATRPSARSR
ncbi:helicase IV [Roseobacter sp. MED193]|uniref:UvrD-helicase domain-containing protein n=1 Tax=Roseobacter sp. MED193 TaxID=314262 RepID=UPI000068B6B5|nr:UvrD-helicase domain-containing protein [Roseobacter sp. MED193]EAQ47320.1 helicase IV [Roseobacter sp. MED193]